MMMTPPRRNTQSVPLPLDPDDTPPPISFTGDALARLGRVESQVNQILPVLGKVAESVENLNSSLGDIKVDMREMRTSFNEFQINTASYGQRIGDLEDCAQRTATQRLGDLAIAKDKAEAIIEEERKQKIERRNKVLTIIGTAISGILATAILTWLGLKH